MAKQTTDGVKTTLYKVGTLAKMASDKAGKKPPKVYKPGDTVELTDKQAAAWRANRIIINPVKKASN